MWIFCKESGCIVNFNNFDYVYANDCGTYAITANKGSKLLSNRDVVGQIHETIRSGVNYVEVD